MINIVREFYTPYYGRLYFDRRFIIMTYKQIEASREVRLWIGQIIVPAASVVVATLSIPEVRQMIATKAASVKESIQNKTRRRKNQIQI